MLFWDRNDMPIRLENVSKSYTIGETKVKVLNDVSLNIKDGDFVSIVGPSGSGKSTMLHMIGALDRPTAGKVYIDEKEVSKMNDSELAAVRGRKIGFIFQTFNLIPRLTAVENIILPMWFADREPDRKKAEDLLGQVGLSHRMGNKPGQMSGGEKQRVAIARALANEPEVIVADEPTGNLDSKTGAEIMKILTDIHASGRTVVLVTHDLKISDMAQRKVEMKDGMIIREMMI